MIEKVFGSGRMPKNQSLAPDSADVGPRSLILLVHSRLDSTPIAKTEASTASRIRKYATRPIAEYARRGVTAEIGETAVIA